MRRIVLTIVALGLAWSAPTAQEPQPTCNMCPGTYIAKAEFDQYLKRAIDNKLIDQQIRGLDIGHSNVGIGVVYRGTLTKPEPIAEHDLVSELYRIIDGTGTVVLGGDLAGLERRPASSKTVRVQNGPGNGAKEIRDGVAYNVAPGDILVIPAGTGHQWTKIEKDIRYLMVRFDPDKIVPGKNEADSKADLLTTGVETPEQAKAEGAKHADLEKDWKPTCVKCPGYYIAKSEFQAYVDRAIKNQLVDQQVRAVSIGKAHVGVGAVYRSKQDKAGDVAEHDLVSEVYQIIDGSATLKLGPDMVGKVRRPATMTTVRLLNGPGNGAKEIRNGVTVTLNPGDVVVIPAGTGHQFMSIPDHITYMMVRIDPDKVLPLKTEADSKADLLTDGRTTAGGGAGAIATPAPPKNPKNPKDPKDKN